MIVLTDGGVAVASLEVDLDRLCAGVEAFFAQLFAQQHDLFFELAAQRVR